MRTKTYLPWLIAAVILALPGLFGLADTTILLLSQMGIAVILALAYNMLLGQGGMLSFGHAIYFGLAGYMSVHILNSLSPGEVYQTGVPAWWVWLFPLIGGLFSLIIGILIGYISTRRAGTIFALISLGFAELVTALTFVFVSFFHGEEGVQTNDSFIWGEFGYYQIAFWAFLCTLAMYLFSRTPLGRMSNAVRDNPERVQFVGYNTRLVRWRVFSISAFFCGIAGALHAFLFEHVGFETVGIVQSGLMLFMAFIGGARVFFGPILGAILITLLNFRLSDVTEAWNLYLGVLFVAIVMFAPGGLAGMIMMHRPIWMTVPQRLMALAGPYAMAAASAAVAAGGLIGLIEMGYFLANDVTFAETMVVYWVEVAHQTIGPWIVFAAIAALGAGLCRYTFPIAKRAWDDALADVQKRMA